MVEKEKFWELRLIISLNPKREILGIKVDY